MQLPAGQASFDYPFTSGDDQALLDDYLFLRTTPLTLEIDGLTRGRYSIYTYAWYPPNPTARTSVRVNGKDPQLIGGIWQGGYREGVIYAKHSPARRRRPPGAHRPRRNPR